MAMRQPAAPPARVGNRQMSYEDYLLWSTEDKHAEWVDGEVIIHMPPTEAHQALLGFLFGFLRLFADMLGKGKLLMAPFEMKLGPRGSARQPDIVFVSAEHLDRLTPQRLKGPADLVIEIVSTDSVRRDRFDKLHEYARAGVREYWVLDPRPGKLRADFLQLEKTGEYALVATEDDERYASAVLPGLWLRPTWLWQADQLDPFTLFCEIAGLPEELVRQFRQQAQANLTAAASDER
jgi:Uma2 family endonuclease